MKTATIPPTVDELTNAIGARIDEARYDLDDLWRRCQLPGGGLTAKAKCLIGMDEVVSKIRSLTNAMPDG